MREKELFDSGDCALIPLYQWRGRRPLLLDLNGDQRGTLVGLLFVREGDCCMLPLAWRHEAAAEPADPLQPLLPFSEGALAPDALTLAQASLEADGWQVSGRLEMYFSGRYSEERFWDTVERYLE